MLPSHQGGFGGFSFGARDPEVGRTAKEPHKNHRNGCHAAASQGPRHRLTTSLFFSNSLLSCVHDHLQAERAAVAAAAAAAAAEAAANEEVRYQTIPRGKHYLSLFLILSGSLSPHGGY